MDYDEDIQIQNQYDNYNNAPVNRIKIDEKTEHAHVPEARAPTGRIEAGNDEDTQIQNQCSTYNNTPVDHIIKKDEEDTIIQLEENDAVMTVLAYFNYSQCQTTKDAGSSVGQIGSRNIMDTKVAEHIYGLDRKMAVTALAYFGYSQCLTAEDDRNTAGMCLLNTHGLGKKMIVTVPTYLNYFQNQTTEDEGPIMRYYVLRNIKDPKTAVLIYGLQKKMVTKQNDVTQAGSD